MKGRGEIDRLRKRLQATIARAPEAGSDPERQSDFARYLCVLISGYLESVVVALILDFSSRKSAPAVAAFVERELKHWTNPKTSKLLDLLGSFDPVWRSSMEGFLDDQEQYKISIDSLVALRHQIAHGESVGTSLGQMKTHYSNIEKVIEHLVDMIDPL